MILEHGEVIVGEKNIVITKFTFGNFKPIDIPWMWAGGIEALIWARRQINEAISEAKKAHKKMHFEMIECDVKED